MVDFEQPDRDDYHHIGGILRSVRKAIYALVSVCENADCVALLTTVYKRMELLVALLFHVAMRKTV